MWCGEPGIIKVLAPRSAPRTSSKASVSIKGCPSVAKRSACGRAWEPSERGGCGGETERKYVQQRRAPSRSSRRCAPSTASSRRVGATSRRSSRARMHQPRRSGAKGSSCCSACASREGRTIAPTSTDIALLQAYGCIPPRTSTRLAVMRQPRQCEAACGAARGKRASASSQRSTIESGENPPKMTLWATPMRVHASIATGSSGIIGM